MAGVQIEKGTLVFMSQAAGNVGGGGGVGGGDPNQPADPNPSRRGSTNLPADRAQKILEGEWVNPPEGHWTGGHAARMKSDPRITLKDDYSSLYGEPGGASYRKITIQKPEGSSMPTHTKGNAKYPHSFFPESWSDTKILDAVIETCRDPANLVTTYASDGTSLYRKVIDGVPVEGYVNTAGEIVGGQVGLPKVGSP